MNKICFTFLLALLILNGCNKIDDLLTFRITHQTAVTIESNLPINAGIDILTPDIQTNSTQEFQNNNTRADLVKDIRLEELKISIENPESKTFSFLKEITIYISTNENDEMVLASLDNIDSSAKTLTLKTTTDKLDNYVKASTYALRTSVTTRETLTQDVDIRVNLKFKVTAESL